MSENDEAEFYNLLLLTCKACQPNSKPLESEVMVMIFEDLERYPLDLIKAALSAHRRDPDRGQWLPSVAHIEHQIEKRRVVSWLSADEAWAQVPKIEGMPGILNQVSAQALAVAAPLLAEGEDMPARMAFKGAYNRLMEKEKLERRGPKYFLSPGGSQEDMAAVRDEAVRQGLLPAPKAQPAELLGAPTGGARPNLKAMLLTMKPKSIPKPEAQDYE